MADLGDGQLLTKCGGSGGIGGHARDDLVVDPVFAQPPDLFGDGAVKRWIAGMNPRHMLAALMGGEDLGMRFIKGHRGGVQYARAVRGAADDFLRHERPRVETDRTFADDAFGLFGQEFGITGACANEVHRHAAPPSCFRFLDVFGSVCSARSPSILRA